MCKSTVLQSELLSKENNNWEFIANKKIIDTIQENHRKEIFDAIKLHLDNDIISLKWKESDILLLFSPHQINIRFQKAYLKSAKENLLQTEKIKTLQSLTKATLIDGSIAVSKNYKMPESVQYINDLSLCDK